MSKAIVNDLRCLKYCNNVHCEGNLFERITMVHVDSNIQLLQQPSAVIHLPASTFRLCVGIGCRCNSSSVFTNTVLL